MKISLILFLFSIPISFFGQSFNNIYRNDSITFIDNVDSSKSYKSDSKFEIAVWFDEKQKSNKGQFLIQNLKYQDEIVIFTINKILYTVDEKDMKGIVFDVTSENREKPVPTKIILYANDKAIFNMMIDAPEYIQTFENLISQKR